ncbi:MAG: MBOAT family protein [Bacteroidetes bacterium]|nr:MBOAT family protein [Bacteroidota bacterium]
MLFTSVAFLIFLPCVVLLYYLLPARHRWLLLLPASYLFYGWWKVEFLVLILFSTLVDYLVSRSMYQARSMIKRRLLLGVSLVSNLGLLFLFKYVIMFTEKPDPMILNIYSVDHPIMGMIKYGIYYAIPVGISFYTFQTLSYTIDVYFQRIEPEKHFGRFALFVSFFPQLVAGPIERFSHLMPQLKADHRFNYENVRNAFRLMLYGFFIKMCVADNIAPLVDAVYTNPNTYTTLSNWIGTLGFGFQIYADFAGYSLIAQGAALLLGIQLMDNFRTPYLSTNITEFWSRWHISLSTWFRDYLYIPLGGNRVAYGRWVLNIAVVFAVSGLWHGADWKFMVWGLIHGAMYLLQRMGKQTGWTRTMPLWLSGLLTFIGVQFAWIFFRIDGMEGVSDHLHNLLHAGTQSLQIPPYVWLIIGFFILSDWILYNTRVDRWIGSKPIWLRWITYAWMLWCIAAWSGVTNHPFIYFQF